MAGISDKALKSNYAENKYRFNNGTELANKEFSDGSGLEMYETPFRSYDPQLGIFHQIDPLADISEDYSPYAFALDNPISYNDAWGLSADTAGKATADPTADVKPMEAAVVTAKKKDCVTCDATSGINAAPPPSTVPAPINGGSGNSTASFAITVTALGEGTGGGITITGASSTLPVLLVAGSVWGMYDNVRHPVAPTLTTAQAVTLKMDNYPNRRFDARPLIYMAAGPWGEQYTLRARADGHYPLYQWGKGQIGTTYLHRGDIWKIGTTINGTDRYSNSFLLNTGGGLTYTPEFMGPVDQLIFVERMKLLNYAIQNGGTLPPGNTKLQ